MYSSDWTSSLKYTKGFFLPNLNSNFLSSVLWNSQNHQESPLHEIMNWKKGININIDNIYKISLCKPWIKKLINYTFSTFKWISYKWK